MRRILSLGSALLLAGFIVSCGQGGEKAESVEGVETEVAAPSEEVTGENVAGKVEPSLFGEELSDQNPVVADELFASLANQDTVENIIISGKINSCCQKKGCWMKVDMGNDKEMMVRFKDYGFFMPMDCSGSTALMEGKAFVSEISVDELRHYAEDAGKSEEEIAAITEPEVKYSFLAQGVVLTDYVPTDRTPPSDQEAEGAEEGAEAEEMTEEEAE